MALYLDEGLMSANHPVIDHVAAKDERVNPIYFLEVPGRTESLPTYMNYVDDMPKAVGSLDVAL